MRLGDLVYTISFPQDWGFIINESSHKYKVYWHDGDTSWIFKRAVKKCP